MRADGDRAHSLTLIEALADAASCPVIAMLEADDPAFVRAAADRGLSAYALPCAEALESAIELAQRRFADLDQVSTEVSGLERALQRQCTIERAKGVLMERHAIGDGDAYTMLLDHARSQRRRLVDVAQAVLDAHALLPHQPTIPPSAPRASARGN